MFKLALDVDYKENTACVAGVLFNDWRAEKPSHVFTKSVDVTADYQPGAFYLRELPCLLSLILDISVPISTLIVDGYVQLGNPSRPGLGEYLYNEVHIPVVGVAKKYFKDTPEDWAILRGKSSKPLYVSSIGIDHAAALGYIQNMHGNHRIPTLLKDADRLCRDGWEK